MSINKNYTKLDQKIIILLVAYPNRFTIGELPDIFYENTTRVKESINKIMGSGHLLKDDITGGLSIDIKLNVIWATEMIQKGENWRGVYLRLDIQARGYEVARKSRKDSG